ncbi:MAG TPA: ABC transporter permease [Pyrinomonadaceae bacterium]|nr:ABC transporter permease [Pyrinomonadaceae bacterium]
MKNLVHDIRYGARVLSKSPGFTAVAVLALALGVAANTAIFSVVNAVLIRPLPYRDPARLVLVWEQNRAKEKLRNVVSPANFIDWREQTEVFEEMAAYSDWRANLTGGGEPVEVPVQYTTPNLFRVLGARPILGRDFTPDDARPEAPAVVVISHGLWQRRFGSDPGVVGRAVTLNGTPAEVVGVMPAGFQWFVRQNSFSGKPAELWSPFGFTAQHRVRRGRYLSTVARLKDGVTEERARAELSQVAARLEEQYPDFNKGWGVEVTPLREQFAGQIRPALWVLLAAVGFLLLIACANVANLLLARATARRREVAIRAALGASRQRLARQFLTESVLLALAGGATGLLLAWWGVELLVAMSPRDLVDVGSVQLDLPVLGFTLGVSLLTAVFFGVAPALEAARHDAGESLKEGGKGSTGGRRSRRLRAAFVVSEVALALMLLVGAGLAVKSFVRLESVSPGFDPDGLLTMRVDLPYGKYGDEQKVIRFQRQALERVAALPGVESAGAVSFLPFAGPGAVTGFNVEGRPAPPPGEEPTTDVRVVDENYFRAMRVALLRGRGFSPQEQVEARRVAVVSESLAKKYFPGEDPLGKRIRVFMKQEPPLTEIVGVVADVKSQSLDEEPRPTVYWPLAELPMNFTSLVVRAEGGDPEALAPLVRREILAMDAEQPVADVRTMNHLLAESVGRARFSAFLLGVFACVAAALAAVGLYAVMSYAVAQRLHEIGVRVALGAQGRDILVLVVRQGLALGLAGAALGLAGALALTRLMRSLLYEVSTTDLATYVSVSALLLVVTLLACVIPARRATKVDPMVALRYE